MGEALEAIGDVASAIDNYRKAAQLDSLVSAVHVAAAGRKPGEYYVVRLSVGSLRRLGLTVIADEQEEGPAGHALILELSLDACQREKTRLRELQVRLAELATQDIVHSPKT